jgi:hypothetical protein
VIILRQDNHLLITVIFEVVTITASLNYLQINTENMFEIVTSKFHSMACFM